MKNMIVFTTLFVNRVGNQSMSETIKGYSKYYNIYIITSSSQDEAYYVDFNNARKNFPKNVYFFRTPQFFHLIIRFLFKLVKRNKNSEIVTKLDTTLINLNYSFWNLMSFKLSYLLQIIYSLYLLSIRKIKSPDLICAYEIGGVTASVFLKHIFKKAVLIAKMQGTVLYGYINSGNVNSKSISLDVEAYMKLKEFDVITMTNDGTFGDIVLDFFKVKKEQQIFLTNGISKFMIESKNKLVYSPFKKDLTIKLTTISRLIGWKRVYLTIELINEFVNNRNYDNIFLNIYGFGNETEKNVLINLIDKYDLNEFVKLNGSVEYQKVPDILNEADFLISLYKSTNVTNPLLEAVYLNVPIISIEDVNLLSIINNDNNRNTFLFKEDESEMKLINDIADFISKVNINKIRSKREEIFRNESNLIMSWEERVELEINKINEISKQYF
jgi:hypothetical protein